MNRFQRFMLGRYGPDQLGYTLLGTAVVLSLLASFGHWRWLQYVATILLVVCIFRLFSKQGAKRWQENQKFMQLYWPLKQRWRKAKQRLQDRKNYRYYHCPNCKQEMRVPKGKGKIAITCPQCKQEFIKKT